MNALLLIDHGSRKSEANELLEDIAATIRKRQPGLIVHIAHLEIAEPSIAAGFKRCVDDGAKEIVVHPFMLGKGRHVTEDIPAQVASASEQNGNAEYHITEPLGRAPSLIDVITMQFRETISRSEPPMD